MKILFALPFLPRQNISIKALLDGNEPLSGSQSSTLLVADALAKRGHTVGLWVMAGHVVNDSPLTHYGSLETALKETWDRIILASWGDSGISTELQKAKIRPILWTHIHVPHTTLLDLESNKISSIITVSDTARLPLLHSCKANQIGSIHNPVNPFFLDNTTSNESRYTSNTMVFCGHLGLTKGAHLVLEMWLTLKELVNDAKLIMIGSANLYKDSEQTGSLKLASPEFEAKYLQPIVQKFGSLEKANITFTGLMSPQQIKQIYNNAALGLINFNWHTYTETFCCVGAEMLATGLPIFSFAAGSLPETMGRTGGALLCNKPDLKLGAKTISSVLKEPKKLADLGASGKKFVSEHYSLKNITDSWELLLTETETKIKKHSGEWRGPKNIRYYIERIIHTSKTQTLYRNLVKMRHKLS